SIEGVHGNRQSAAHYFAGARLKPADATISGSEQPSPRTCVVGTCPAWPSAYGNREEDTNNSDTRARHASECAGERWEAAPTSPPAPGRSGRNGVRRDHRHRVLTGRGVDPECHRLAVDRRGARGNVGWHKALLRRREDQLGRARAVAVRNRPPVLRDRI